MVNLQDLRNIIAGEPDPTELQKRLEAQAQLKESGFTGTLGTTTETFKQLTGLEPPKIQSLEQPKTSQLIQQILSNRTNLIILIAIGLVFLLVVIL